MTTTFYTKLLKHPNYMEDLFENLQTFSFKETFADLRFVCANRQTVYAHKLLLCSVSRQLKKMISELPTGLDVVTINIPDIDVNKLSIVIEFLYKGQTRLLSEHCKDFEEIMTILGIEFQFPKIVERQLVAVLPGQPTVVLPNTSPLVSHNGSIIFTPNVGLPQNQDLSHQNLPTKTFLSVSPHSSLPNIQVLPIAHFFPNQPAEILVSNYNENQNTVTTSHTSKVEVNPKAVVINAEEAYKLIRKNNEPSFLDRIKHNPQVSLTNVSTKSGKSDSTLNTTSTNLNRTAQVCRNSNVEENRNLNNTNAQKIIIDVEDEEVQCISVNTNISHTKKIDSPIYIDLAGIEDTPSNGVSISVDRGDTNIIKDVSVNSMCIDLFDDTQVTSVNRNINLSTQHNVKNNTNQNRKYLPIGNTQPGNRTLQNRINENFNVQQKSTKRAKKSVGFYNEDNRRMKKGSTLMEQKNSKDGNASTTTRVEERLGNRNESTLAEQTNGSQSVTNTVTVKKGKRRKFLFKNVGGLEGTMSKVPRNCRGRRNSLGMSSRGRKLKPSSRYPIRQCCEDEGAEMDETTQPILTSELTAKTASVNKGNTQSEEILSTATNTRDTRHHTRLRKSFV